MRSRLWTPHLSDLFRRYTGGDGPNGKVARYYRVRTNHTAIADAHPAGYNAVDPKPAVGADLDRPLAGEALLGYRPIGIIEAVSRVADKATVGEHRVIADLDRLQGRQHRVAIEKAVGADLNSRLGRQRQPAAGLQQ